jgi:hypothetical protein
VLGGDLSEPQPSSDQILPITIIAPGPASAHVASAGLRRAGAEVRSTRSGVAPRDAISHLGLDGVAGHQMYAIPAASLRDGHKLQSALVRRR